MADSHEVSRPGGEQYLVIEHDGETYKAVKESFQREVDGELVEVQEYRLDEDLEDIPDPVVAEVDRANGDDEDLDEPTVENNDLQDNVDDDRPDDRDESDDVDEDRDLDELIK